MSGCKLFTSYLQQTAVSVKQEYKLFISLIQAKLIWGKTLTAFLSSSVHVFKDIKSNKTKFRDLTFLPGRGEP